MLKIYRLTTKIVVVTWLENSSCEIFSIRLDLFNGHIASCCNLYNKFFHIESIFIKGDMYQYKASLGVKMYHTFLCFAGTNSCITFCHILAFVLHTVMLLALTSGLSTLIILQLVFYSLTDEYLEKIQIFGGMSDIAVLFESAVNQKIFIDCTNSLILLNCNLSLCHWWYTYITTHCDIICRYSDDIVSSFDCYQFKDF